MYSSVSYKTKQFFSLAIKLSIVIGASYFIYTKLMHNDDLHFQDFLAKISAAHIFNFKTLGILCIATLLNWSLEILKWKNLVSHIKHISFLESTAQSLGALTASLMTPNRIGEYGAKALYFAKPFRKKILGLNLLGNMSQMLATICFGLLGFGYFVFHYGIDLPWFKIARIVTIIAIVGGLTLLGISNKKYTIKGFSFVSIKDFVKKISFSIHLKNISYSFLRYAIFSHQFYFLIQLFYPELPYVLCIAGISSMYLISSLIPMLFIFDVIVKGSVAVWIFSYLGIDELTILSIIMLMWILNFVIPSAFGSFYVLNFNPFHSKELDITA